MTWLFCFVIYSDFFALCWAALIPIHIPLTYIGLSIHAVCKLDNVGKYRTIEHISADGFGIDLEPPTGFDICNGTFRLLTCKCFTDSNTKYSQ